MTGEPHSRQIVVWDVPATIERGAAFRLKAGVRCEAACEPDPWRVEVRDHDGKTIADAELNVEAWPGTAALYYAELELEAPAAEGLHAWTAVAPAAAGSEAGEPYAERGKSAPARPAVAHGEASASFNVRVVPTPECRLTVVALDRQQQTPIAGARVVVHPYRASTDADGVAEIGLPKGPFRLFVSGREHLPFRTDGELTADTTIRAELDLDIEPSDAELWS